MTDFAKLEQDIRNAARTAYNELTARSAPEPLCAFALYSDEGAMTVCPSANTATHLATASADYPEYRDSFELSPAEWKYEAQGADEAFDAICDQLREGLDEIGEGDDFVQFKRSLFTACGNALKSLKEEGLFQVENGQVLLLFHVSDSDDEADDRTLIRALNDEATIRRFERWAGPSDD